MITDPGDLVLDITRGSGTTANVAENWGRRWITCDTSRVQETLYDQPFIDNKKLRITGPFTVEAVPASYPKSPDEEVQKPDREGGLNTQLDSQALGCDGVQAVSDLGVSRWCRKGRNRSVVAGGSRSSDPGRDADRIRLQILSQKKRYQVRGCVASLLGVCPFLALFLFFAFLLPSHFHDVARATDR